MGMGRRVGEGLRYASIQGSVTMDGPLGRQKRPCALPCF